MRLSIRKMLELVTAVLVIACLPAGFAAAHSGLNAASPGPGAIVGGDIDQIQLFYGDIITEIEGSLTTPSGDVLDSTFTMLSDIEAVVELTEPLAEPGEYALRHSVLSVDGDRVDGAYLFTYDPAAPPPRFVFLEEPDGSGLPWFVWVIAGLGALLIAVLAWRLVASVRRRSQASIG